CRRGGDHLEDVGAAGLVGESLGKITRSCLHLLEQADIADGDHGLVGKGLQQGDLLVAEPVHLFAAKRDRAEALTLAQQRYAQNRAVALLLGDFPCLEKFITLWREEIGDLYRLLVDDRPACRPVPVDGPFMRERRYGAMVCAEAEIVTALQTQHGIVGVAE